MQPPLMNMSFSLTHKNPQVVSCLELQNTQNIPWVDFQPSESCCDRSSNRWVSRSTSRTVSSLQLWTSAQTWVSGLCRDPSFPAYPAPHTKVKVKEQLSRWTRKMTRRSVGSGHSWCLLKYLLCFASELCLQQWQSGVMHRGLLVTKNSSK